MKDGKEVTEILEAFDLTGSLRAAGELAGWAQWDWGQGPRIGGRVVNLFCAWLAWSRFRVVIPTWDRTLPTVIACLDRSMGAFGGAPTY